MAIDVNGLFGRWPVRTPGIWEPAEYLRVMDRFGIERSLICSTTALLDNTPTGNDLVAHLISRYPDRLSGAAVVNPHPDPDGAAAEARRRLDEGFAALRLYPGPHGYSLSDVEILEPLLAVADSQGVPVIITLRVSGATPFPETPAAMLRPLAARCPGVALIVAGATYSERLLLTRLAATFPNLYLELSQMQGADAVAALCQTIGSTRLLLGTGMGVQYASPGVRKVERAPIDAGEREAIGAQNARRLLRLP